MKQEAKHGRTLKKGLPRNPTRRKVTGPQVIQAYHKTGTVTAAAKSLGIAKSTASEAIHRAKGTPEYQQVIQPKLDELRLQLAAITLLNTKKVQASLKAAKPGWDHIRCFGTIVDKVHVLAPASNVNAMAVKVEINLDEKRSRFLKVGELEPDAERD